MKNKYFTWKKIVGAIAGVVFFIAALVAVLEYFGIKPFDKKDVSSQKISYTQTANTNYGTMIQAEKIEIEEKRIFSNEEGKKIEDELIEYDVSSKNKKIIIFVNWGDSSSLKFASELKVYLSDRGWQIAAVTAASVSSWPYFKEFPGIGIQDLNLPPPNQRIGIFIS